MPPLRDLELQHHMVPQMEAQRGRGTPNGGTVTLNNSTACTAIWGTTLLLFEKHYALIRGTMWWCHLGSLGTNPPDQNFELFVLCHYYPLKTNKRTLRQIVEGVQKIPFSIVCVVRSWNRNIRTNITQIWDKNMEKYKTNSGSCAKDKISDCLRCFELENVSYETQNPPKPTLSFY